MPEQNLNCGIHATYLSLRLLGDSSASLGEVVNAFPGAKENGSTLNELISFFEKKGYYCMTKDISEQEILGNAPNKVYVVLKEQKEIGHLVVKRKSAENELQIFNFPKMETFTLPHGSADKNQLFTLIVSREPIFHFPKTELLFSISLVLFLALLFSLLKTSKKNY
jgi:hypothetical protein